MPYRLHSPVTHRRIGRRGACLFILGFVSFAVGGTLFVTPRGPTGHPRTVPVLADIAPAEVWATTWMVLGGVAMLCAFGHWRAMRLGFVIVYTLPLIWGAANLTSWFMGELVTGWIAAIVYWGYSLLVVVVAGWEEPLQEVTVEKREPTHPDPTE